MCDNCTAKIAALPKDVQAMCVAARLEGKVPHLFKSSGGGGEHMYAKEWHNNGQPWATCYELVSISADNYLRNANELTLMWVNLDAS